jgi:hypothetical protein
MIVEVDTDYHTKQFWVRRQRQNGLLDGDDDGDYDYDYED